MQRGRGQPRRDQHLRLGSARAPRRASTTSPRLDEIIELPPRGGIRRQPRAPAPPRPPPWLTHAAPRDPADGRRRHRAASPADARRTARARRSSASARSRSSSRSPSATAPTRPSRSGTSPTNSAATTRSATATCRPRRSARWLRERYGDIDALNDAWGTAFWSQRYGDWDEILPPRATLSTAQPGPGARLRRFSSDELLDYYRAEARRSCARTATRRSRRTSWSPRTSATWTTGPGRRDMDVVANDHYLDHRLADPRAELVFRRRPHPRPRRRASRGCSWSSRPAP